MEQQGNHGFARKRAGLLVAGVAAGALLLSGGTFALWNTSGAFTATTVTNGKLASTVTQAGITATYRATDSPKKDTAVTLSSFKMVPGDIVEIDIPVKVELEGDNLYAQMLLTSDASFVVTTGKLTVTGQVFDGTTSLGAPVTFASDGALTETKVADFRAAAAQATVPATATTSVPATTGKQLTLRIKVEFPSATTGTTGATIATDLSKIKFNLKQVRPSAYTF